MVVPVEVVGVLLGRTGGESWPRTTEAGAMTRSGTSIIAAAWPAEIARPEAMVRSREVRFMPIDYTRWSELAS